MNSRFQSGAVASPGEVRADGVHRRLDLAVYLTCEPDEALGSAYVALGFARRMRERGHQVEIFDPGRYEPLRRWRRGVFYRQTVGLALHALSQALRRRRDALVFYGGEAWLAIVLVGLLPRRRRPLLVVHSNGLEPNVADRMRAAVLEGAAERGRWFQLDSSRAAERGFRRADALIVVSDFEAQFAKRRRLPASGRLLVIENPLPDSFLLDGAGAVRENVVGFCGRWSEGKGMARIRREIPVFLRQNPAWQFRLLGSGGEELRDEFPEDLRDRIEVLPPLAREGELAREYERVAILVSASVYESFGLVMAEAMARGCAVVAAPVGFASGLRDREEALLCDAARPGALAAALEEVARDSKLRNRIATGGSHRVQQLRWGPAVESFEASVSRWVEEVQSA